MTGIGVIGYGYWGPNLVRNFAQVEGAAVTAVCDANTKRLEVVSTIPVGQRPWGVAFVQ